MKMQESTVYVVQSFDLFSSSFWWTLAFLFVMGCLGTKVYIDVKTYYDAQKRRRVAMVAAGGWLSVVTLGWIFSRTSKQKEAREKQQGHFQVFGHIMDVIGKVIDAKSKY